MLLDVLVILLIPLIPLDLYPSFLFCPFFPPPCILYSSFPFSFNRERSHRKCGGLCQNGKVNVRRLLVPELFHRGCSLAMEDRSGETKMIRTKTRGGEGSGGEGE